MKLSQLPLLAQMGIYLLMVGSIWGAFYSLPQWSKEPFYLISPQTESKWGFHLAQAQLTQLHVVHDAEVQGLVNQLATRLTAQLPQHRYTYRFYVVKSPEVNAYAMAGGTVIVNTGLISFAKSPEEIAAVLAHEIGHVERRHLVKRVVKGVGLSVGVGLLTGGDPGILAQTTSSLLSSGFDRGQESEADDFGCSLLIRSGIKPVAMATFFDRMGAEHKHSVPELLSTHPGSENRSKEARARKLPTGFTEQPLNVDLAAAQAAVLRLH